MKLHVAVTQPVGAKLAARLAALLDPTPVLTALSKQVKPHPARLPGNHTDGDMEADQVAVTLLSTLGGLHQ